MLISTHSSAKTSATIRVACVGDSITEGCGYPDYLQTLLGQNYTVGNFGVNGSTVTINSDNPYIDTDAFGNAVRFCPDVVVIMLGTNDAKSENYVNIAEFQENYKRIVSAFWVLAGKPDILLVDPPPIYNNTLNMTEANMQSGIIPRIEQVAKELNLPVINIHEALIDHPEYLWDGVHPCKEGAEVIADKIYDAFAASGMQS